jgi:hypothetical protein
MIYKALIGYAFNNSVYIDKDMMIVISELGNASDLFMIIP